MRISDWSSDVCSSDLLNPPPTTACPAMYLQYRYPLELTRAQHARLGEILALQRHLYNAALENRRASLQAGRHLTVEDDCASLGQYRRAHPEQAALPWGVNHWTLRRLRSEEHTSELQS